MAVCLFSDMAKNKIEEEENLFLMFSHLIITIFLIFRKCHPLLFLLYIEYKKLSIRDSYETVSIHYPVVLYIVLKRILLKSI